MAKKRSKRTRSRKEWTDHVKAQENSKLTVTEYCRRHGISVSMFYRKRKKIRQSAQEPKQPDQQDFKEFHKRNQDAANFRNYVSWTNPRHTDWERYIAPLKWTSLDDDDNVKVKLPNKVEISVPCDQPDTLKMVMEFAAVQTQGKGEWGFMATQTREEGADPLSS